MRTTSWLAGLALVCSTAASVVAEEEFGPNEARALLPRAAAGDGEALRVMAALGAAVTPTDLKAVGTVPLTHLLLLAPTHRAPESMRKDFRTLTPVPPSPADLLPVLYGAPSGRPADRRHDFPSFLHDEYLTDVTCTRTGDTARGEVRFAAPGVYEGRAEWTARKGADGWQVVELVIPSWRLRVRRDAAAWVAERVDDPTARWYPTFESMVVASEDLPTTGTVVDAPERAAVVALASDGALWFAGQEGGLDELATWMRTVTLDPRMREPDGSSRVDLVVRFDRRLPWMLVQWVLQSAASERTHRIHFAVRPEAGGEDGVLEAFLPKDRGVSASPATELTAPVVRANVFHGEGVPDLGAVYAAIRAQVQAGARTVELGAPMPKVPAAGHVIAVYDLALRAGAEQVRLLGAPMPSSRASPGASAEPKAGSLPWLRAWVRRWAAESPSGCVIKVGETRFASVPRAPASSTALPPPPPRRGRAPAAASVDAEPTEIEESAESDVDVGRDEASAVEEADVEPGDGEPFEGRAGMGLGGAPGRPAGPEPTSPRAAPDPAVEAALRWLAAHQAADGRWSCAEFGSWCDGKQVADVDPASAGRMPYDVGVTGLALLAFLGAGYTNRSEGPYGRVVAAGLRYLKNVQDPEGCFGPRFAAHFIYNHAIASLAMIEAFGATGSVVYRSPAQKSLDFSEICRNPYFVWRYGVKPGDNDTSVTGWMAMALQSARAVNRAHAAAGRAPPLTIEEEAFDGIRAWLDKMTDPGSGRVGYLQRGMGPARPVELVDRFPAAMSESTTAIGVLLRMFLGEAPETSDAVRKGVALIERLPPRWDAKEGSIDFYYWHAAALAMHRVGGDAWAAWQAALREAVVRHQRTDGDPCTVRGSWDPVDPWGPDGGRVYATAIVACTLLAPRRAAWWTTTPK